MTKVFVVDGWVNAIRCREWKDVFNPELTFNTELEATDFVLSRAEKQLSELTAKIAKTKNQVHKWKNLRNLRAKEIQP